MSGKNQNKNQFYYAQDEAKKERVILVGVELPKSTLSLESSLAELAQLAHTAGYEVVGQTTQKLKAPYSRTYIGSGKIKEITASVQSCKAHTVIFDDELSPSQQMNLEKAIGHNVKIIDRTELILDIFAMHAKSKEGRLQVLLAQNQYLYSRLRGMWEHLTTNRMGGGVGSRFGEGETQLEADRRMVQKRITTIKRELSHLNRIRGVQRQNRYESGIYKIALAGYTNAGKSSLLNSLTDADVLSYNKLFATLDSTTRKFKLPEGRTVTLTDTVGFIQKLPTTLVEAFKSTLSEIVGADLILHVIDASSPEFEHQRETVQDILGQIGAQNIICIDVFNKADLLSDAQIETITTRYPLSHVVSAHTKFGLDELMRRISLAASADDQSMNVVIPYDRGDLVSLAHEKCNIIEQSYDENGTHLSVLVPQNLVSSFELYNAL